MVTIHHILGMFLILTHHSLSYRIPHRIKDPDDPYNQDYISKLKMLRLLKYVNRLNHENILAEYEDDGYPEQNTKKPEKFRYHYNKNNMQLPSNLNYEIIISEPIKRNGILFDDDNNNNNNKMKSLNYYDLDEYDENNVGYDDLNYQKMFKNYIQRNSDHQRQRNAVCKICKSKQPCQCRQHPSAKKIDTLKNTPKLKPLKSSILYEYSDENDLPKSDSPHNKHKQKGFQLFMLNDEDELASSFTQDEMRTTRFIKHFQSDDEDRNHKYRRYQEGNKQRKYDPNIKSIYIKISDIQESDNISPLTISPKHIKDVDYSDFESTESEKVVHIPPLKHTTIRNDMDFDKLATKRHHVPEVSYKNEFSDAELERGENVAVTGDEYDELKTTKNYVSSSTPSSSNNAEYDDYGSSTGGNDYENFMNINYNKNDIPSYEDDSNDLLKKSKKIKNSGCNGPCEPPSNDYEVEIPSSSTCSGSASPCGSSCNLNKSPCGTDPCSNKGPCGTQKNPCPSQKNQCTEKVLNMFGSNDDSLTQNFQMNNLRPYTGNHPNWNSYYNKRPQPSNDQSFDPYKFDYDEARQAHKFYSSNNYKSNEKTMPKGEWFSTKRPDGLIDDEIFNSENDKKQQTASVQENNLLRHLKQHKTYEGTSKSTLSSNTNDYGLSDLSTRPDKRNNKKQRSSIKIEDDEDYNNDMFVSTDIISVASKNNGKSPNRRDNNDNKENNSRVVKDVKKKQQRRQATTSSHSKSKRKNKT
nr:NAD-dependent protein deacetylase Sir2B-like [Onthophagus taurus]